MCGIIGYIGKKDASTILLDGLKRLEYRGYDSAGLVVGKKFDRLRVEGRVGGLADKLKKHPLDGTFGIAHTRWATHGWPSEENAHPHTDHTETVYVVHNGIIENYKVLKRALESEGHVFSSSTDTEVLAHLVKKFLDDSSSLEEAVKKSLRRVRGAYALLVMSKTEPGTIVAARQSSPLRLGVGDNEFIIASDPSAIVRHTRQLITLEDGEIAVINEEGFNISELNGNSSIGKQVEEIDWDIAEAEREGHAHFMLKEIFEQPRALNDSIRGRLLKDEGKAVLGGLKTVEDKLRKIKRLHIIACGTAYYAGMIGEYLLEEYAGVPVEICIASEFRYRKPILNPEEDAVLVISQSGETADTLAGVKEAKEKGVLTLAIVNVTGSTIARETDAGVYNHVGPEIGVASTKVFTSQLALLTLLTLYLGRQRDMSLVMGKRIVQELHALPEKIEKILEQSDKIKDIANKYRDIKDIYYLGRKYNYPSALEGAMKIKEISYIHAEGGASGEMKHGPLAMIDEKFPAFFIVPKDSVYEKNISNMEEVKARKGKIIAVVTEGDYDAVKIADEVITIPKTLEMLTPILAAVPLQLFAYHFAVALGRDVDKPRNLAKSVTVE